MLSIDKGPLYNSPLYLEHNFEQLKNSLFWLLPMLDHVVDRLGTRDRSDPSIEAMRLKCMSPLLLDLEELPQVG
jgi:hypothetical protein